DVASGLPVAAIPAWRRALPIVATAGLTALVVGSFFSLRRPADRAPEVVRFTVSAEASAPLFRTPSVADFALSPDGRTLVYLCTRSGAPQLYVRRLDQLTAPPLAASPAYGPFLSPDDQWVGYFGDTSETSITKIPLTGGSPVSVAHVNGAITGAAWLDDRMIVYSHDGRGLFVV